MTLKRMPSIAAAILGTLLASAGVASAQSGTQIWLMGGVQNLNQNDTAFPDDFLNVPAVLAITYPISSVLALEADATWVIPVEQSVDLESGEADRKTPDVLAYQGSLRVTPASRGPWKPYLIAGAGAATFLSNDDEETVPGLDESQTAFAINFGGGLMYSLGPSWSLRADFRELVAFPAEDAQGLSDSGDSDDIRMERGTIGLGYRF